MKLKSQEKEDKICQVVLDLTSQSGLAGLRMSDIAQKADLAHGTIYIYFKNKRDLINQVYSRLKKEATGSLLDDNINNYNFVKGLEIIWRRYLIYLINHQKEILFMQQCVNSDFLDEESKKISDSFKTITFEFFNRGIAEGYVKELNINLLLSVFTGISREIVYKVERKELEMNEQLLKDSFELCWNAMRR